MSETGHAAFIELSGAIEACEAEKRLHRAKLIEIQDRLNALLVRKNELRRQYGIQDTRPATRHDAELIRRRQEIVRAIRSLTRENEPSTAGSVFRLVTGIPYKVVGRLLNRMCRDGVLIRSGSGSQTHYRLPADTLAQDPVVRRDKMIDQEIVKLMKTGASYDARELKLNLRKRIDHLDTEEIVRRAERLVADGRVSKIGNGIVRYRLKAKIGEE